MNNDPVPPKPDMAGFIRMIAEAIADKIIEDQKRASRVLEKPETAPEPSEPPPEQGKEKETGSSPIEKPRPPPPETQPNNSAFEGSSTERDKQTKTNPSQPISVGDFLQKRKDVYGKR